MKNILKVLFVALFIMAYSCANSQNDGLSIFKPLVNAEWIGNYINSSDSTLNHYIKWEFSLDSSYIKQTKEVPKLSFKMETYFYWDYELGRISSLSMLNRAMISKGKIELNMQKLELYNRTFNAKGYHDSKQTFEIAESGDLRDYFYKDVSGEWVQGHLIIYKKNKTLPD